MNLFMNLLWLLLGGIFTAVELVCKPSKCLCWHCVHLEKRLGVVPIREVALVY